MWAAEDLRDLDHSIATEEILPWRACTLAELEANILAKLPKTYRAEELSYFLSQYYYGELFAIEATRKMRDFAGAEETLRRATGEVYLDELRHADIFSRYLNRRLEIQTDPASEVEDMFSLAARIRNPVFALLTLHVVVEAWGLGSITGLAAEVQDPVLPRLLALVARDEARHMSQTQLLPAFAEHERLFARDWIQFNVASMCAASLPLLIYRKYLAGEDLERAVQAGLKSAIIRKQSRRIVAILVKNIRSVPELAPFQEQILAVMQSDRREALRSRVLEFIDGQ